MEGIDQVDHGGRETGKESNSEVSETGLPIREGKAGNG
jgi:hypothetical protein